MPKVTSKDHLLAARKMKQLYSRYMRGRDLVSMGAYIAGTDAELDEALKAWPKIQNFLRQESEVASPLSNTLEALLKISPAK